MRRLLLAVALTMAPALAGAQEPLRLYAAGSLRASLTEVSEAFTRDQGAKVALTFGASGLLRERIEKGEPAEVFASADMQHPTTLMKAGKAGPVTLFVRNQLCGLAQPGLAVSPAALLDRRLDPTVKLGTSTPRNDPSGDYTWVLFEKAEKLRSGAFKALDAKALKLVGAADSPQPPAGRTAYGWLMGEKKADLFLTYCTNAILATREVPGLQMVSIPEALAVGADYGLTVMKGARTDAGFLALYILSPAGQQILARHGFTAVAVPAAGS